MGIIKKFFNRVIKILGILALILIFGLCFTTFGYRAANISIKVAEITIMPTTSQRFSAEVAWIDGEVDKFDIAGDQFYIDAKILKWQNWLGMLGVKTWYELDRIGGRYLSIQDETDKPRTIYQLAKQKDYDLYHLRKRHPSLDFLVDAEYGSAVFMLADTPKKIELYVARTGLTIKQVELDQPLNININ